MEYVLVGILVLLLVGGFVTVLVMQATKRSRPATRGDQPGGDGPPGQASDSTPLGDTTEHAGDTTAAGETVGDQDADESGGTGGPVSGAQSVEPSDEPEAPSPERRFQRDPIGGEAEARPFTNR